MQQYQTFELTFQGPKLTESWSRPDLQAVFTNGTISRTVKGFYDGEGRYVIRFLPEIPGTWRWQVSGLLTASGEEVCEPAAPGAHGLVKAVGTHFEHQDGAFFYPFGTTVYALASQDDALVEQTLEIMDRMGLTDEECKFLEQGRVAIHFKGVYDRFTRYIRENAITTEHLQYNQFMKQLRKSGLYLGDLTVRTSSGNSKKATVLDFDAIKLRCDVDRFIKSQAVPL